ncbi:hypothetical protein WH47_03084 [Habropoda laboriosa]|uniref:SAP domain-containing protein n=1 Tax=Habropoda laboriosa TaxID=597456 RepID=A0A0L7QYA8_9HYME|nr:hypothetical protein WH47_03084 [Habropoda laboriosa]
MSLDMSIGGNSTMVDKTQSSPRAEKMEYINVMKLLELRQELRSRKLKTVGKKNELQDRLRVAVKLEIEHGADEDEDEDERDNVRECVSRMHLLCCVTVHVRKRRPGGL